MKGISPLIASVLLLAFTMSISMIVMGWFSSFTRVTTENVSYSSTQAVSCSAASVSIERVYVTGTSASIIVKNDGFSNLNITGVIVNSTGGTCLSSSVYLTKGNITSLTLTGCYGITAVSCTGFSRAVVNTNCGGVEDTVTSTSDVSCS